MKKLALLFSLLIITAFGIRPLHNATTNGTRAATQVTRPRPPVQRLPACDGKYFPMTKNSGSSSCAPTGSIHQQPGREVWHAIGQSGGLAHRYIGSVCINKTVPVGDNPFPHPGATTMLLQFGPCGAAKDPLEPSDLTSGTNAKVFLPTSGHGFGYTVTTSTQTVSYPEPYVSQPLYPPVTAGCPYTLCVASPDPQAPGRPAVKVTVSVPAGSALGSVQSAPPGITLSGAGEASGSFSGDVVLIGAPTDRHVRAVFSGDCQKTEQYGQRAECIVKLAPDPTVTVTFECETGFTCGSGSKD